MTTLIAGASVWEQEFFDHVSGHIATEAAILDEYQRLAEDPAGSPAFRYLADLILADERRHHQLFNDLAESIRKFAALQPDNEPIPSLAIGYQPIYTDEAHSCSGWQPHK